MAGSKTATSSMASKGIGQEDKMTKALEHRALARFIYETLHHKGDLDVMGIMHRLLKIATGQGTGYDAHADDKVKQLYDYINAVIDHLAIGGFNVDAYRINLYFTFIAVFGDEHRKPVPDILINSFIAFMFDSMVLVTTETPEAVKYLEDEYPVQYCVQSRPPFLESGKLNVPTSRGEALARGCTNYVSRIIRDNYVTPLEEAFLYIVNRLLLEAAKGFELTEEKAHEFTEKMMAAVGYFMTPQGEVTRHTFTPESIPELKQRISQEFGVKIDLYISPAIVEIVAHDDYELQPMAMKDYNLESHLNILGDLYRANLTAPDFDLDKYQMPTQLEEYDFDEFDDDDESDADYDDDDDDESDYDDEDSDAQPSATSHKELPAAFHELFNHVMSDIPIESEAECAELMQVLLIRVMALQIEDPSVSDLTVAQLKQRLGFGKATGEKLKQLLLEESFNTIKLIDVPEIGQKYQDLCKKLELQFKKFNLKRDYKSVNIRPSTISTLLMVNNTYEHVVGTQRVQRIYFVSGDTHIELEPILSNELNREAEVMLANFVRANLDTILATGSGKLEDNLPSLDLDSQSSKKNVSFRLLEDEDEDISVDDAMAKVKDKQAFAKDLALTESTKLIAFPRNITNAKARLAAFKRRFGRGVTSSDNALESFIFTELDKLKAEVKAATDAPKQKDASLYDKKVQMALASWLTDDGELQSDLATDKMRQAIADYIDDAQWCILPVNSVALEYATELVNKDLTARSICAYKTNGQVNPCSCPDEAEVRMEALKRHVYKTTDRISDEQLDIMRMLNIHADLKDTVRHLGYSAVSQIGEQTDALAELLTPRGEINKDCFTKEKYQNVQKETYAMARSFSKYNPDITPAVEDILRWNPSPFSYDYEENRTTDDDIEAIQKMQNLQRYGHYHSLSSRERKVLNILEKIALINDDIKLYSRKVFFDCCLESAHRISAYIEEDGSVVNTFSNKDNRDLEDMVMRFVQTLKDLKSDPDKARYKYY